MKTDWKDDVFEGEHRKYNMITNGDGTVSFEDMTTYTQQGDEFGAKQLQEIGEEVNRIQETKSVTLPAANWTGTKAPFVQTVTVEGITETDKPGQGIIYPENCTRAQQKEINRAADYLYDLETGNGTVTFRATVKPEINITIGLKGVG